MVTYAVPRSSVRTTRAAATSPRAAAFDEVIEAHATAQGVSPDLVRAVIQVESAFNPQAVSSKGAMGLMQLMPATARELGVVNPFLPEENIRGGVAYLRQLLDKYDRNVELALAAYNAGPGSVAKYGTVPPYRETQAYVKKVTGASGPAVPAVPDTTIYKWVDTSGGTAVVRYGNKPPKGVDAVPVGRR
jgi:soluble lytic murein transglycosylase-like protein